MKPNNHVLIMAIITSVFIFLSIPVLAQNTQVKFPTFGSGFGVSNSANSGVTSAIGGIFTGTSESGTSTVTSGFLAYTVTSFITDAADRQQVIPKNFDLGQNYPNPFNPSTVISWQIPVDSYVVLKVYDILGNEISTLVNEERKSGVYQTRFDAATLASGMYVYRLSAGNNTFTKKMLMIK